MITHLLEDYWKNEKVLFIFDNCDDVSSLQHVLLLGCKHVITTQLENWPPAYQVVCLNTWSEDTALKYLKKVTMTPWTTLKEKEYKDMVKVLGLHPLGIQHAATFMKQTRTTVKQYLEFLSTQPGVMAIEKLLETGVKQSVFQSFLITIDKIRQENEEALEFLFVLGLLDGTCIDERITKRISKDEKYKYVMARSTLLDYSVIQCHQRTMEFIDVTEEYITIHSTYQRAVRYILNENKKTVHILEICLSLFPYDEDSGIWYNQFKRLWQRESYKETIIQLPNMMSIAIQIYFVKNPRENITTEVF